MKDNEIRDFVSALTKVAEEYGQTQQLRERIRGIVFPFIEAARRTVSGQEAVAYLRKDSYGNMDVVDSHIDGAFAVFSAPIPATEK